MSKTSKNSELNFNKVKQKPETSNKIYITFKYTIIQKEIAFREWLY